MHTHSHKHTQFNTQNVSGVRLGLEHKDLVKLTKGANHKPMIQRFAMEDFEGEPEERTYWCALCKSELVYLSHSETIWRYDNCLSYYDTKIQDTPIKDKSEFKLHSYHDPYQQYDENDPNFQFIQGIDIEEGGEGSDTPQRNYC